MGTQAEEVGVEPSSPEFLLDLMNHKHRVHSAQVYVYLGDQRIPASAAGDPASPTLGNRQQDRHKRVAIAAGVLANADAVADPLGIDVDLLDLVDRRGQSLDVDRLIAEAAEAASIVDPIAAQRSFSTSVSSGNLAWIAPGRRPPFIVHHRYIPARVKARLVDEATSETRSAIAELLRRHCATDDLRQWWWAQAAPTLAWLQTAAELGVLRELSDPENDTLAATLTALRPANSYLPSRCGYGKSR